MDSNSRARTRARHAQPRPPSSAEPLCTPTYPCNKKSTSPPFYGPEAKPALIVTLLMGLQHMLAMIGGIITPPRLLANRGCLLGRDPALCAITPYLISSAMLASGILTIIQITRIKLCGGYYLGTGLISVMGTSFTFLPIGEVRRARPGAILGRAIRRIGRTRALISINETARRAAASHFPLPLLAQAIIDNDIFSPDGSGLAGYGKFIGTCLVGALLEIILSFVPPGILKKLFPPIVTGTTVFCIGVALTGTGLKYWGGGVFCAQNMLSRPMEGAMNGNRFIMGPQSCQGDNGGEGWIPMHPLADDGSLAPYPPAKAPPGLVGADLPYGSTTFVGLGALVVLIFIVIECFGTAFMRNCNIIISLLLGYAIASGIELDPICRGISKDDGSCICGSMSPGWLDEYSSGDGKPEDFQCLYKQQLVTGMFRTMGRSDVVELASLTGTSHVVELAGHVPVERHRHRRGLLDRLRARVLLPDPHLLHHLDRRVDRCAAQFGRTSAQFGAIRRAIRRNSSDALSIPSGDISITAAYSANSLDKSEEEVMSSKATMSRIQGGLLADGINSLLAALFLTPPNTTFSQNNGVIQITACASRAAGFACAGWLILLGIFVPIGAFFADIPLCVLGGMVTILFCSIMVGGAPRATRRQQLGATRRNSAAFGATLAPRSDAAPAPLQASRCCRSRRRRGAPRHPRRLARRRRRRRDDPNFLNGGGVQAFYGSVLNMNVGFWPLRSLCEPGTETYFSDRFPGGGPSGRSSRPTSRTPAWAPRRTSPRGS